MAANSLPLARAFGSVLTASATTFAPAGVTSQPETQKRGTEDRKAESGPGNHRGGRADETRGRANTRRPKGGRPRPVRGAPMCVSVRAHSEKRSPQDRIPAQRVAGPGAWKESPRAGG